MVWMINPYWLVDHLDDHQVVMTTLDKLNPRNEFLDPENLQIDIQRVYGANI